MRQKYVRLPALRAGLAASAGLALAVSACGSDETEPAAAETTAPETVLSIEEPWVKSAEDGMTAAFGTLVNSGDEDLRIVSAQSPASPMMELHEVAMGDGGEMVMREKGDGFVVPAGGEHILEPGADHIMLMDLAAPIVPGDEVDVVLTLEDGSTFEFSAQAKDFAGADENYQPGEGHDG